MALTIPPNAPFTGAQKMWLKGFLDGVSSVFPVASEQVPAPLQKSAPPPGVPVTILWGSQTGNAEALGKKLGKMLTSKGHSPILRDMSDVAPGDLAACEHLLIITSTYGDGEPPDNAASLHSALAAPDAPTLPLLHFAVLALGDSNYPEFCKCGHDFHSRLITLGANPMIPMMEADVDYDPPFTEWVNQVERCLARKVAV